MSVYIPDGSPVQDDGSEPPKPDIPQDDLSPEDLPADPVAVPETEKETP